MKKFLSLIFSMIVGMSISACAFFMPLESSQSASSESKSSMSGSTDLYFSGSGDSSQESSPTQGDSSINSSIDNNSSDSVEGEQPDNTEKVAPLSIHFPQLGNRTSGDCTIIKVGNVEVLIDAGSTTGSIGTIIPYIKQYCTDGVLEYVIATHGHEDHISGFTNSSSKGKGVFESFECSTIIDFAKTVVKSYVYDEYVSLRNAEVAAGAKHYTALECWNNENGAQRRYTLGEGVTLNILYQKYYQESTTNENNNSVCTLITQGENHYLFTGDLEAGGEKSLVESNKIPECTVFKAGHHGSNTSNTAELLLTIQPEVVVATCCCGDKHGFPNQEFIDNISIYTDKLYIPSYTGSSSFVMLNGNITVSSSDGKTVSVKGSNNNTLFKDTAWFKQNRVMPATWV